MGKMDGLLWSFQSSTFQSGRHFGDNIAGSSQTSQSRTELGFSIVWDEAQTGCLGCCRPILNLHAPHVALYSGEQSWRCLAASALPPAGAHWRIRRHYTSKRLGKNQGSHLTSSLVSNLESTPRHLHADARQQKNVRHMRLLRPLASKGYRLSVTTYYTSPFMIFRCW